MTNTGGFFFLFVLLVQLASWKIRLRCLGTTGHIGHGRMQRNSASVIAKHCSPSCCAVRYSTAPILETKTTRDA